jgi:ABC-type lipoprotein release transport system permease subunit
MLLWLLIVVLLSIIASLVPARNAARLNVRTLLASE